MHDNLIECCLDFETYWDDAYSLSKMSTVEYINDPRFEVQVCSVYIPFMRKSILKLSGEYVTVMFKALKALQRNGKRIRLIGHNLAFDGMICKLVYDVEPDTYFDTSTMCWFTCGNTLKNAKLETLAAHFDLRPPASMIHKVCGLLGLPYNADERKLSAALRATKGLRLEEMPKNLLAALAEYCASDVWLTWELYQILNVAPPMLLAVQDQRLQALIRLPLEIDVALLEELRAQYSEDREDAVMAFGASYYDTYGVNLDVLKTIRSKPKFKALLLNLGVPEDAIPMKPNKKGDGMTEAFAKNDMALDILVEAYPDLHLLSEAVELRLNYNSSMVESKFNSFINAGRIGKWGFHVKPLSAPNTIRHAGGSATGSSPQNLKRASKPSYNADGVPTKTLAKLGLRDAIMSPPGRELVVADLSGIELRTAMWLAQDDPAIAALSDPSRDLYTEDGRVYFDRPDMTKADKELRDAAKVVDLSCQYLVGWRKILHQARVMGVPMTIEMAQAAHKKYRVMHPAVVRLWNLLVRWLQDSTSRRPFEEALYPVVLRNKEILMPSGFVLRYPDLRYDPSTRRYTYWSANRRCRINVHAGMIVENISQHLAGHVFNGHQLKVAERLAPLGGIFVGDVHDEMLFTVPDGAGELALKIMLETMSEPTPWWPELVTFAEGDHGYSLVESPDPALVNRSRYGCLK